MTSQFTLQSTYSYSTMLALGLAVLLTSTGCSTLNTSISQAPVLAAGAESEGMYQVEMTGGFGKSGKYQGEIIGPMTIQSALEQSGAIDKFRTMDITVYRVAKKNGASFPMPCIFEAKNNRVLPSQDYALRPNDRIIVKASVSPLDKLIDSINPTKSF